MRSLTLFALLGAACPVLAAAPAPGEAFQDCPATCPQMVVLPAGSFTMGTPADEQGRQSDEGPQHTVTFSRAFAISRYTITYGELKAWLSATRRTLPDGDDRPHRHCSKGQPDEHPLNDRQPAVCIDYDEIQAYAAWLSERTGHTYRMVTEAEREYAARAGSTGPFPFPLDPGGGYRIAQHANTYGPADGYSYTAPVGSFPPNAFGVYDMHGNVYEFVADCYHDDYRGAPSDGSAWMAPDPTCKLVSMRGNDYGEAPIFSRSGNRNNIFRSDRGDWLGFRLVREL